ncbi:MAG: hypothetical protein ABJI69_09250 [Balneola sp.]
MSEDEKIYLDEKFGNLQRQITALFSEQKTLRSLEVELAKRPTITQLLIACATTAGIAISIASIVLQ